MSQTQSDHLDLDDHRLQLQTIETPENPFKGFKDYELQRLDRLIDWMRQGKTLSDEYVKKQKANFYKFFSDHDRRRDTNFLQTFPEMEEFFKQCKYFSESL